MLTASQACAPRSFWAQRTLDHSVFFEGIGLHTGQKSSVTIFPGRKGVQFIRSDQGKGASRFVSAHHKNVSNTQMCTQLTNDKGVSVLTVEHILSALSGLGIQDAEIEIDGPEIPILDGSSSFFTQSLMKASHEKTASDQPILRVKRPIRYVSEQGFLCFLPSLQPEITLYFSGYGRMDPLLPQKMFHFTYSPKDFTDQIASARTFGFYEDGVRLQAAGFAQGASLDNTLIIRDGKILNPEGLRFEDEFLRHKILDVIGDLSLAALPIHAHIVAVNPGHGLNHKALSALFDQTDSWDVVSSVDVSSF